MIPHNMPLFKFICALYQFHHQTLPIMIIDRDQIQFQDYIPTGTEPEEVSLYKYYYAPFEKGGHIALHLSVGMSVGQSVCRYTVKVYH